jgi:hypothetical protein
MPVTIQFKTDSAAFEDNGLSWEIGRVLEKVLQRVEAGHHTSPLYDTNGNHIGNYVWEE